MNNIHSAKSTRLKWSLLLTGVFVSLLCNSAFGYGYHDALDRGTHINTVGIRSAALGGTHIFGTDDASNLFLNPAGLSGVEGISVYLSGATAAWNESVHDSTMVTQRGDFGIGGTTGAFGLRLTDNLVIAGGMGRIVDNQYRGTHYLPNDPSQPEIDIVEILESTGGQWEALGGISFTAVNDLSVGVSAGMRMRHCDYTYQFDISHTQETDSIAEWSESSDEFCYRGGLSYLTERFESGVTYSSETDFYYSRVAFGARLCAAHLNNIWVGFEGEVVDPFGDGYFEGRLSFEIPMEDKMEILTAVGFIEGENMYRTGMIFSLGGTAHFAKLDLDFVLSSNNRCRTNTTFPEEYSDYVNDSWTTFGLGFNYTF